MKLEDLQAQYLTVSDEIIAKQQERISIRWDLYNANRRYHETGKVTFKIWEVKSATEKIEILKEEIENLKEIRDSISQQLKKGNKNGSRTSKEKATNSL